MVKNLDQCGLRSLLAESIVVLCKNGLQYNVKFTIQGLLGITVDDGEVLLVDIHEKVGGNIQGQHGPSLPEVPPVDDSVKHRRTRAQKRPYAAASWSRMKVVRSEISQDRNVLAVGQCGQVVGESGQVISGSRQVISHVRQDEQLEPSLSQNVRVNDVNSCSSGTGFGPTEKDENCDLEMNVMNMGLQSKDTEVDQSDSWATGYEKQPSAQPTWQTNYSIPKHNRSSAQAVEPELVLVKEEILDNINVESEPTSHFQPFTSAQSIPERHGAGPSFDPSAGTASWGLGMEAPPTGLESTQQITSLANDDDLSGFINQTKITPLSHNFRTPSQPKGPFCTRPRQGYVTPDDAEKYGMLELAPGIGVFVYPEDLAEAALALNRKPGRKNEARLPEGPNGGAMARVLLKKFYSTADLVGTTLSLKPNSSKKTLDPTIVEAILVHCIKNSNWPRYKLRDVLFNACSSATCKATKQHTEELQPPPSKT